MRKIFIGLTLLVALVSLFLADQYFAPQKEVRAAYKINQEIALATVKIEFDGMTCGTGVVVEKTDKRALVLTCNHVIDGLTKVQVVYNDGMTPFHQETSGTVVRTDKENDLALVETAPIWPGVAQVITPHEYDHDFCVYLHCLVLGYPVSRRGSFQLVVRAPHLTEGLISDLEDMHKMRVSAPAMFGNSGSGVWVNIRGHWKLVGILHSLFPATGQRGVPVPHIAFATQTQDLLQFLGY